MKRGNTIVLKVMLPFLISISLLGTTWAQEVNKGEIPTEYLAKTCKSLPWGVKVWDLDEAIPLLNNGEKILWVDTRPDSFYEKGTVRGAICLTYNKTGEEGNALDSNKLENAVKGAGLSKENAKIAFFCQGPDCHRSYNAAIVAVKQWGYSPQNVYWFRDGYPELFKHVKGDSGLKRKAKNYLSDAALSQL